MVRLKRTHTLLILAAGALALLVFLSRRTLTEHEVFAAEPAREMLAGKGWVLQPFAGEYRTKKPPGQSWLIAASLAITRSHSEWVARLPSALAGIGLAMTTALMAARLGTSRQGLIAGLMTLTCVGVQQRANLAEADMALALCVAVANACLIPSPEYSRGRAREGVCAIRNSVATPQTPSLTLPRRTGRGDQKHAGVFWGAVVAGFMLKGPIVLGFTLLPAAAAWAVMRFGHKDRQAATAIRSTAFWWPAVLLGMLLILSWPAAALIQYPEALAQWKHELVDRTTGSLGHGDEQRRDAVIAYLWLLPESALPWTPFALVGAWLLRRGGAMRRPANVLLLCWCGGGLVMLSAIAFKVLHYALPIVSPVLMLAAMGFDRLLTQFLRRRRPGARVIWERVALSGWFGIAVVGWMVWNGVIVPEKDWGQSVKDFAEAADQLVPENATIYFYRSAEDQSLEDQTAWYLHHPLRRTRVLPEQRPVFVICGAAEVESIGGRANVLLTADPVVRGRTNLNDRALVLLDH